ncbi:Quaternary ammonium compound-resistance protein SugE [compost metagenome]
MAWLFLMIAGLMEVISVVCMKLSNGFTKRGPLAVCVVTMMTSFYFLSLSLEAIPIGTAYGVWTGIGSAGSIIVGIFIFHEKLNRQQLLFLAFIIIGVIGLKLSS